MKKFKKDVRGFSKASIGLGLSTLMVSNIASKSSGTSGLNEGMATISGFMPVVGTATMGKNTLRIIKKIKY